MTYGYLGQGGGMDSCPHCGDSVLGGSWHTCSRLTGPTAINADHGYAIEALLHRVVAALDRIATQLERRRA